MGKVLFFSHSKEFNVEICIKLGKILMSITIKILRLKRITFTVRNQRYCQKCQKLCFLHAEITCNPTQYNFFHVWVPLDI